MDTGHLYEQKQWLRICDECGEMIEIASMFPGCDTCNGFVCDCDSEQTGYWMQWWYLSDCGNCDCATPHIPGE